MNWKNHYRKALTFSYDDGNEQDRKLLEILNRYGMKATFNVNTGLNHDCGTWVYRNVLEVHRLNLAECPELYAGHEMAVHGVYHYNLTELTPEECTAELQGNIAAITEIYGTVPVGMAYPYGVNDALCRRLGLQNVCGILKEGESATDGARKVLTASRNRRTCCGFVPPVTTMTKPCFHWRNSFCRQKLKRPRSSTSGGTAMNSKATATGTDWNAFVRCLPAGTIFFTAPIGKCCCRTGRCRRNERSGTSLLRRRQG